MEVERAGAPPSGRQGEPCRALGPALGPAPCRPAPRAPRSLRRAPACRPAPRPPQAEGQSPAGRRPAARSPPRPARRRRGTGNGYEALSPPQFLLSHCLPGNGSSVGSPLYRGGRCSREPQPSARLSRPQLRRRSVVLGPERRPGSRRAGRAASRFALRPRAPRPTGGLLPRLRPRRRRARSVGCCHGHRQPRGRSAPGAGQHPAPADGEPAELGPPAEEVPVHAQRGGEGGERAGGDRLQGQAAGRAGRLRGRVIGLWAPLGTWARRAPGLRLREEAGAAICSMSRPNLLLGGTASLQIRQVQLDEE